MSAAALAYAWAEALDTAQLLRYEDLVLRPEDTVQALLAYLGLDAARARSSRCWGARSRATADGGPPHVADPRESIGRWRRDLSDEVSCLRRDLRRAAGDFGYEPA